MPIYQARCPTCGHEQDYYRSIEKRAETPLCCNLQMVKVIVAASVQPDLPAYESPIDGRLVEGRKARREDLKRSGSRPWEGLEAEKKEAAKQRAYADEALARKADATVEKTFYNLPYRTRKILEGR